MRFFSPFAVLGLLHVARGGELDAFASDRARNIRAGLVGRSVPVVDGSNSSAPTSDVPNIFKREQERREQHARVLDHLDANKDDHIEHDEIIRSLAVHWKGEENVRRMLRAFGAPDLEHFMKRSSPEEDGRVSKETLSEILEQRPLDNPDYCPTIRTKVESCSTQAVLRCGEYLNAAESFCNAGAKNMIEKCIMSESCDNICTCIEAVEDAAHGNGAIEYEGELVQVDKFGSVRYTETGLQPRQAELLAFFALYIWTIIEFLIGITVAYLVSQLYESLTSANPCWSEFDNQDMPGFDMDKGSFFTSKVSVCRNACAGNSTCKAFVIAPFSGNEKDKRPNCFLKTAQRQTQTVGGSALTFLRQGSTVFFKRDKNGNCGAPASVTGVPFDDDWFSTSTGAGRRSLAESEPSALVPRVHKGEVPFPFDRTASAWYNDPLEIPQPQAILVEGPLDDVSTFLGLWLLAELLVGLAADAPYLRNLPLPQWRPTEIAYRWPDSVRQLLLTNSAVVHNLNRGYVDTWLGQNRQITGGETAPYAGVRAGYDQSMRFYQRGNAGPFSLEAAFIMATQVAGVNFRAVARSYNSNPAGWWFGALGAGPTARLCLQERDSTGGEIRTYGRFESTGGSTQHDPRAGVYMAFDLDPTLSDDDPNHNVFVFVVHALDANSVVSATQAQFRAVNVGTPNNWYGLATGSANARFYNQGSPSDTVAMPTRTSNTWLLAPMLQSFAVQIS
ncbi:hypothetical protein FRC10_011159 [Ceratobasidium sp. 414]|nr:hypothetical protein FRC10_011159 [Ceratobasidium sp. 414]